MKKLQKWVLILGLALAGQGRAADGGAPGNYTGTVVDETKNTLVIRTGSGEKAVPKRGCTFLFALPGGEKARLEGARIAFRPFDRPKKVR